MNAPEWWYVISGLFYAMGTLAFVAVVVGMVQLIAALREVKSQVRDTRARIERVSTGVEQMAARASNATSEITTRVAGILDTVDEATKNASRRFESIATVLLGLATLVGLARMLPKRRR